MKAVCMTTINKPTEDVKTWAGWCVKNGWRLYVAGDEKTPDQEWSDYAGMGVNYLSVADQAMNFPRLAELIPHNHYARKNFAYLGAIRDGATQIFDTDDDNAPIHDKPTWGDDPRVDWCYMAMRKGGGWVNVFPYFLENGGAYCWPRGFPLEAYRGAHLDVIFREHGGVYSRVKQFMCDGEADYDAVQRLVFGDRLQQFLDKKPLALQPGTMCPMNSQSTLFYKELFPAMYLPVECTFRATDILRGYVIQRVSWANGWPVTFHSPFVRQERNPHNYLKDFQSEIPLYLHAEACRKALEPELDMTGKVPLMIQCYQRLMSIGGVLSSPISDLEDRCLEEWMKALDRAGN